MGFAKAYHSMSRYISEGTCKKSGGGDGFLISARSHCGICRRFYCRSVSEGYAAFATPEADKGLALWSIST